MTSVWPRSRKKSTASWIPKQEKTSLFPWLEKQDRDKREDRKTEHSHEQDDKTACTSSHRPQALI